jgi:AraC-like DNA-binding protein/ligand-binding sensor protein
MTSAAQDRLESLLPLLEFFSRVTGLTASICTEHKGELRYYGAAGAEAMLPCAVLRKDPELDARCEQSNLHHLRLAHRLQRYVIYECHAGLVDIVVPILGLPVKAGILTGQVLPHPLSSKEREQLARRLSTGHTSVASVRRALATPRFLPEERIEAATKLLADISQYGIGPDDRSGVASLKTYVASELLRRQEWSELQGIARMVGVKSPPRVVLVIHVVQPGWREAVDWRGLHRAREVVAEMAPSTLALVERDKLVVLYSDLDGLESWVRKLLSALRGAGLRVAIGVGRPCDAERPVWQSYHDAEMALGYRFLTDEPIIFLENVERQGRPSMLVPSTLQNLGLLIQLGDSARAQDVVRTLIQELGRELYSASWVLDSSVEILTLLIRELRQAGNRSEALPGILRHFLNSANQASSIEDILALLETSAMRLINQSRGATRTMADLVEQVCEHVKRHLAEPITLERLCAEVLFVSPDHFSRVFQKTKGMRFKEWLLQQRISRMKELLASTNEAIACVAARCGYDCHPYLCRVFRRATGMTPTQYRRAHGRPALASASATEERA